MTSENAPRRTGRPSKGPRVQTGVRLPVETHSRAMARAAELGLTFNDYVENLVTRDLAGADEVDSERIAA